MANGLVNRRKFCAIVCHLVSPQDQDGDICLLFILSLSLLGSFTWEHSLKRNPWYKNPATAPGFQEANVRHGICYTL